MNKIDVFEREYSYIKNQKYVDNLKIIIDLLPDYFFIVPASSTGKYHPTFSLGDGGLVRHTKAALKIAYDLLKNQTIGSAFNEQQKDLMLFSLMLHDGLKSGLVKQKYTQVDHPLLVSRYIKENSDKLSLTDNEIEFICQCIESHMGEWNKDFDNNEILPLPKNKFQKFVHMCDFLASRKYLDIKFEDNNIVE